jgi:predicted transcriptional regulator
MSKREILVLLAECENKALILELYDSLACSLRHQLASIRRAVEADVIEEDSTRRAIYESVKEQARTWRNPALREWFEELRRLVGVSEVVV